MNKRSKKITTDLYKTISENCESLAILIIGISLFGFVQFSSDSMTFYTIVVGFLILMVSRGVHILLSSCLIRCFKAGKVSGIFRFILWFSGLRGAMGNFCSSFNSQPLLLQ
jgi:hypothetical protein